MFFHLYGLYIEDHSRVAVQVFGTVQILSNPMSMKTCQYTNNYSLLFAPSTTLMSPYVFHTLVMRIQYRIVFIWDSDGPMPVVN